MSGSAKGRNHRREAQMRAAVLAMIVLARSSVAHVRRILFSLDKNLHGGRPLGERSIPIPPVKSRLRQTGREAPYVDVGDPEQIAIGHRAETGLVAKAARANPITHSLWAGGAEMPQLSSAVG